MGLPGFLADALPDTWGQRVLQSWFDSRGLATPGALERLSWYGDRAVGALEFEPTLGASENLKIAQSLSALRDQAIGLLQGDVKTVTDAMAVAGGSAGGMHPKYLVGLDEDNQCYLGDHGLAPFLLKVPTAEDSRDCRTEYVYAQMAAAAGITVPPVRLVESGGSAFFAIQRFDRHGPGYRHKTHQHTLAGLLDHDFRELTVDADMTLRVCLHLTRDQRHMEELYRRIVFNYLGHNCDDHAKNISFQMNGRGEWRLSPWYDGSFCNVPEGHGMKLGLSRFPGKRQPLLDLAATYNIRRPETIIDRVADALTQWPSLAGTVGISPDWVEHILQYMHIDN